MRALLVLGCALVSLGADASVARPFRAARAELPAPADVHVNLASSGPGRWKVSVRRNGYLVALHAGERTSAAKDWVGAEIDETSGTEIELGWETTDRTTLETHRGGIRVTAGPNGPRVSSFSLPAPVVTATNRDRLHECRAFEKESDGFTIVCRIARGAHRLSAVSLTGENPLAGVAVAAMSEPVVRIDLPIAEGTAEARLIGYLDGNTAVVVRAEATWVRGEERPTLSLSDGTRQQLLAPKIRSWIDFD